MAPLPKRKHSTRRKGKRMATRRVRLPNLIKCKECGQPKLPHRICIKCGK